MLFFVQKYGSNNNEKPTTYPYATLTQDNWDDFGYKTTFYVQIHLSKVDKFDLGLVKILHIKQKLGYTPIKDYKFTNLLDEYCSLGGDLDYYINLFDLGEDIYKDYLESIQDVVLNKDVREKFNEIEGYKVSLLRFNNIESIISDAEKMFKIKSKSFLERDSTGIKFNFRTRLGNKSTHFDADFSFVKKGLLPNRLNVVIGYNGSGKTRLLSNLAVAASGYGYENKNTLLQRNYGYFTRNKPTFKPVIVVSYSAFDTFSIPGNTKKEKQLLDEDGGIFGYVYCGLRKRSLESNNSKIRNEHYYMKSMDEINDEFYNSLKRIYSQDRAEIFQSVLAPLIHEPSFRSISIEDIYLNDKIKESELANFYASLSSGHKIIIKILADITAQMSLSQPSLLLIDEPEVHLHPSLQAAFLQSIRICLELFDGYAILTTHSPVILQEMPSRYIRVLRRLENTSTFDKIKIETFGENINIITEAVFNLDDSMTNWNETLKSMAERYSNDKIERFFGKPLGFAPRSYLASISDDEDE